MSSMEISWIVFGCIFGGAVLGMIIRAFLPAHHLAAESKDLVKMGMGLIATMAALVLGLLVASAKSSFDAQRSELSQIAANVMFFDRTMARYGPETKEIRDLLQRALAIDIERLWPKDSSKPSEVHATAGSEIILDKIMELSPKNETQRSLQAQALKISADTSQMRWLLFAQRSSSIPLPFLVVLVFWLAMLFVSFSLFAKPNLTVVFTLLVCALSVSSAIFLILELDHPFGGLIQISSEPLRNVVALLGR